MTDQAQILQRLDKMEAKNEEHIVINSRLAKLEETIDLHYDRLEKNQYEHSTLMPKVDDLIKNMEKVSNALTVLGTEFKMWYRWLSAGIGILIMIIAWIFITITNHMGDERATESTLSAVKGQIQSIQTTLNSALK